LFAVMCDALQVGATRARRPQVVRHIPLTPT
jgi:hypothetical protein